MSFIEVKKAMQNRKICFKNKFHVAALSGTFFSKRKTSKIKLDEYN